MSSTFDPWQKLKNYERAMAFSVICLVLSIVTLMIFPGLHSKAGNVVIVLSGLGAVAAHLSIAGFRCPRCNKQFFRELWYTKVTATQCVHCGKVKNEVET
ncbi:MAG: hypothetical protein ACXWJD_08940 [Burkholderiaceae bacterium]